MSPSASRVATAARFPCAVCGTMLRREPRSRARTARGAQRIVCPRCRFRIYDYPRVCTGFAVVKRDRMLMLIRGQEPRLGAIDFPGGFFEAGEELEQAARRELREETGLTVGRATMLGTWWDEYDLPGFGPFPTFNVYYLARWRSGVPRAGDDAAEAHWMAFTDLARAVVQRRFAWKHMRRAVLAARRAAGV